MHYIRLLRSPALAFERGRWTVSVVLTITTDLGDAFLNPHAPIKLKVGVYEASADEGGRKVPAEEVKAFRILDWVPGTRVLKTELQLTGGTKPSALLRVFAFPSAQIWGGSTGDVVSSLQSHDRGRIMPVWADVQAATIEPTHLSCRRLRIGKEDSPVYLEVEEDIGESIARHVWDAGVAVACLFLEQANPSDARAPTSKLLNSLASNNPSSIVEIGCGVGILGLAVATWFGGQSGAGHNVLLTDLPEARQRAEANASRWSALQVNGRSKGPMFEALDWEDGRKGIFGPTIRSCPWDLVILSDCTYNVDVLPALVGTLSALHDLNKKHPKNEEMTSKTHVLLATKPRHSSEEALFPLMANEGWSVAESETFPLPVVDGEIQSIQLYLFEK